MELQIGSRAWRSAMIQTVKASNAAAVRGPASAQPPLKVTSPTQLLRRLRRQRERRANAYTPTGVDWLAFTYLGVMALAFIWLAVSGRLS